MKKLIPVILIILFFANCCRDDDNNTSGGEISDPAEVLITIDSTNFNGLLEVYPCTNTSTIYNGVYYNGNFSPFPALYDVVNGVGTATTIPLNLTIGTYNLIMWGYPNYSNYYTPGAQVDPPALKVGTNLGNLFYSLSNTGLATTDTTYFPVYDMALGTQIINIGTQNITTNLNFVTAGMNVIVSNSDSTAFSTAVDTMWMYIGGINYQLNFTTGIPTTGNYKTVSIGMSPYSNRSTFSTDSVYVFPSATAPLFQLFVQLNTGTVKTFNKNLATQLGAGTFTTIYVSLNGLLLSKPSTGTITIDNWVEQTDSITFPTL